MRTYLRAFALTLMIAGFQALAAAQTPQIVQIHEGKHWIWYARSDQFEGHRADIEKMYDYADRAFEALEFAWGMQPKEAHYTLLVYPKTGGGFASNVDEVSSIPGHPKRGIGISYDAFYNVAHSIKAYWAYVLITHEMTNMFTGELVSGGWPRDWWADDKSPFPYMTAVQIELKLVPEIGINHLADSHGDLLIATFMLLKDRYGWEMFRRAFQQAIDDKISWDRFGGNPSELRTNYVAAYLEMGARDDLSPILSPIIPAYNHEIVSRIIAAHRRWQAHPKDSKAFNDARDAFLSGNYKNVQ
jgi:hypothetical protein